MTSYQSIRVECCEANRRLPSTGLVDLTFGNVSVIADDQSAFAIKPSGVPYEELTPEHMVLVYLDGNVLEGDLRPSSDTPTHRGLFRAFATSGVRSIVHTHARNAVAFAQAALEIPCLGTTHADYFYGSVPLTRALTREEVEGEYEWETANVILERFAELHPLQFPSVLVRQHGPFSWGTEADKAVDTAVALEAIADIAWKTMSLAPGIGSIPQHLRDRHFLRKHGSEAYYGQA